MLAKHYLKTQNNHLFGAGAHYQRGYGQGGQYRGYRQGGPMQQMNQGGAVGGASRYQGQQQNAQYQPRGNRNNNQGYN
jgi:hypothetical protein